MQATQPAPKLNIHKSTEDRHTLLRFEGVIDEDFGSGELADSIDSDLLVLELSGVKRVTSFGIREWIGFIDAAGARAKEVFLVDCSPRFVIQLNMVVGFVGRARILSLLAPYICEHCGHAYDRRMDLLGHEAEVRGFSPSPQPCESCGNESVFDDDPTRFFAFVSTQSRPNVAAETAAFLARYLDYQVGQAVAKVRIAKLVEGRHTVLRLLGELNDTLPVAELQEGLEGEVALDVSGVARITPSGIQQWRSLLRGVRGSVERVRLFGLSPDLIPAVRDFLREEGNLIEVHSIKLPYRDAHATTFSKELSLLEHGAVLSTATAPALIADDGETSLTCIAEPTTLIECSEIPLPQPAKEVAALVDKARQTLDVSDETEEGAARRGRRWPWILAASAVVGGLVAIAILLMFPDQPLQPLGRALYQEASHLSPPLWKDKTIYIERGRIVAVSQSVLSPDKTTAFVEANNAALETLIHYLYMQNQDPVWAKRVGGDAERMRNNVLGAHEQAVRSKEKQRVQLLRRRVRAARERIARAYTETSRQLAPPVTDQNYWESYREDGDLAYRVWAQITVSEANFNRLREHYVARHQALGATVVSFFPLLSWELPVDRGAIALAVEPNSVLAKAGLRPGDIVLKVNDLVVTDGLGFQRQVNYEHLNLQRSGGTLTLDVSDFNDQRRTLSVAVAKKQTSGAPASPGAPRELPPANIWHEDPRL